MSMGCALTACGGGGGSAPSSTAAAAETPTTSIANPPASTKAIYFAGDSTMWGSIYDANNPWAQAHPNATEEVQTDLGSRVTVTNAAIPGSSLVQFVYGTSPYTASWRERVAALPQQYFVENFAINDAGATTPEAFQVALVEFVNATRAAGKIPIIEEPNPICTVHETELEALVNVDRLVAAEMNVPLITQFDAITALPNWKGGMQDCVHPIALYPFKGDREVQLLGPLIS